MKTYKVGSKKDEKLDSVLAGNFHLKQRLFDKQTKHSAQPVLIHGDKGLGKFVAAKLYAARYLMGEEKYHSLDNFLSESETKSALLGTHPDLFIIDGQSAGVKIEEVRRIISKAHIKPNQSVNNVIILRDSDSLTIQAQNTLLKILEDPPENTVLIMTAINSHGLLGTVRSRVRQVVAEAVTDREAYDFLKNNIEEKSEEQILSAVEYFTGNIGKMISYLEEEGDANESGLKITKEIIAAITKKDMYLLMVLLEEPRKERNTFIKLCKDLSYIYEEALMVSQVQKNILSAELFEALSILELKRGLKTLIETLDKSVWNPNLTIASMKLAWGLILIENED